MTEQNEFYVIWVSNEEMSEVIGVASSRDKALESIKDMADIDESNFKYSRGDTYVAIDGHSDFILVKLKLDAPLRHFDKEYYGLEDMLYSEYEE